MEYDLEVYTSAPELLQPGGSNLGVVAQTRNFPADVARSLSNLRYYTFLEGLPLDDPLQHPPRVVAGPINAGDYYSISYSIFAGADHTGRTTPTVHTATVKNELLRSSELSAARFLFELSPEISQGWTGPPRWLDPKPKVSVQPSAVSELPYSEYWQQFCSSDSVEDLVARLAEGVLMSETTSRPVILVLSPDQGLNPLQLFIDVLALLPNSIQARTICVSHILDKADFVRGASIGITYCDTAFYRQAVERHDPKRPLIIDPTRPESFLVDDNYPYSQFLQSSWNAEQSCQTAKLSFWLAIWDECGFSLETLTAYLRFVEVLRNIISTESTNEVRSVNESIARLGRIPETARSKMDQVANESMSRLRQMRRRATVTPLLRF